MYLHFTIIHAKTKKVSLRDRSLQQNGTIISYAAKIKGLRAKPILGYFFRDFISSFSAVCVQLTQNNL